MIKVEFCVLVFLEIPTNGQWIRDLPPLMVDTLKPASRWESEVPFHHGTQDLYREFKRDAVALYESTPGATIRSIAEDLGINRSTLSTWLDAFGTGAKTNAAGHKIAGPLPATNNHRNPDEVLSDAERIRVLERENAKLREEREILRKTAKYFA